MNHLLKASLLTAVVGAAFVPSSGQAAVTLHSLLSNSVNYCQAFTPGPSNTIRNRVLGAENLGAPMAVACNFASMSNGGAGATNPTQLTIWFANNNESGTITVNCSLLTGYQTQGGSNQYLVNKTTSAIAAGVQGSLTFSTADNPNAGATTMGSRFIGINCTMPTGGVLNDTYFYWNQDNGIGS